MGSLSREALQRLREGTVGVDDFELLKARGLEWRGMAGDGVETGGMQACATCQTRVGLEYGLGRRLTRQ